MDWQPPPELCEELDLEDLNNYRIAIGAERIQCRIKVNDPDEQIDRFDDLTNQTYRLTRMIEKYGSKKIVEKLYYGRKLDDLKLLIIDGIDIPKNWTSDLLGQYISQGDLDIINLVTDHKIPTFHPSNLIGIAYFVHKPYEPLIEAIKSDQLELAESLLLEGYSPNQRDHGDDTPLMWAVFQNKMEFIELLLNHGASVDMGNPEKNIDPLSLAVTSKYEDKMDLIKYLLNRGAKPDYDNRDNRSPFTSAVAVDDFEIVNLFIDLGYTVNLHDAVYVTNNVEMIKLLMDRLTYSPEDIRSAFIEASRNHSTNIMDFLFQTGQIDQDTLDNSISDLYLFVNERHELKSKPIVDKLLSFGADINGSNNHRPLISTRNPEIVDFLLSKGADPNLTGQFDSVPLGESLEYRKPTTLRLLMGGARVNGQIKVSGRHDMTPLKLSVVKLNLPEINRLLEFGADPNLESEAGIPLMINRVSYNSDKYEEDIKIIETLISSGADVNFQNHNKRIIYDYNLPSELENKGQTILMYHAFRNPHLVPTLLEAGAEPNVQDSKGNTVLHYIVSSSKYKKLRYQSNIDLVSDPSYISLKSLLEYGADPSIPNHEGKTPTDLASSIDIINFLSLYS